MNEPTDFGAIIRELMISPKITQKELAEKLGVSDGILSNYLTGKNIPEMSFLEKCIKYFGDRNKNLKNGIDIKEFFYKTFLCTAQNNKKVTIDTNSLDPIRNEILAKTLTVLLLYPKFPDDYYAFKTMSELNDFINQYYKVLEDKIDYKPSSV